LDEAVFIGGKKLTLGKLVLSPTRTYLPLISRLLSLKSHLHGLIHCTGGAQSKVLKFTEGKRIIKDHLFDVPPLFSIIKEESGSSWKEMYQVFNMGHRLEAYVNPGIANECISLANELGIEAKIIGRVEPSEKKEVILEGEFGTIRY
jgi:phosphoribosylformylglycinamidine cyclo-ligase